VSTSPGWPARFVLDEHGTPIDPVRFVDLDGPLEEDLPTRLSASSAILVGRTTAPTAVSPALLDAVDLTLTEADPVLGRGLPAQLIGVESLATATAELERAIADSPAAAVILATLLRHTPRLSIAEALNAESLAYSTLLASGRFARWRASRPVRNDPGPSRPAVSVDRTGEVLTVVLDRPERRNAFGRWVRDALCDALDLALLDATIAQVVVSGRGPSFCSGGDLDEFGSQTDLAVAHLIRTTRSVGRRLHDLGPRVVVEVHGACVGAGTELAAFAQRVRGHDDAYFELPELAMGLIPGAGGTVSLPRRIGRWRTAWLALTGTRIDLATATAWGLVDTRVGE